MMKVRLCSVEDCSSKHVGRGYCQHHYDLNVRKSKSKGIKRRNVGPCSVSDCEIISRSNGLCNKHYLASRYEGESAPVRSRIAFDRNGVKGPIPSIGEKAIYFLRDLVDSRPFYVGSTVDPCKRIQRHKLNYHDEIEMAIMRVVPIGTEIYWEARLLVELTDAGLYLLNATAPSRNTATKGLK